jgi:putative N6-adenine-specific DNA methylase
VTGPLQHFFAATAPGLEGICRDELKSLLPAGTLVAAVEGGVEFAGRIYDCYLANLNLHTANRVLMRIRSFYAADFRQLEKGLRSIPWELYLHPDAEVRIQASARQSRLYHKGAINERVRESIFFRFLQQKFSGTCRTDRFRKNFCEGISKPH